MGDASGFKIAGLLSPVTGDQENEVPFDVAFKVVFVPSQIVILLPAFTVNVLFKVTVTGKVAEQVEPRIAHVRCKGSFDKAVSSYEFLAC